MTRTTDTNGDQSRIAQRRSAARAEGAASYLAKRDRLISVAAEVFQEKGFEGATLSDIAERFGTDRASLYYYIADKDDLLQEAMTGIIAKNVAESDRIAALDVDASTKLGLLMRQVLGSYEANYPYTFLFVQEEHRIIAGDGAWAQQTAADSRRLEMHVIDFIEQGVAAGDFRDDVAVTLAANAFFGMLNWTHRWFKPGGRPMSEVSEAFEKVFIDGLRAPGSAAGSAAGHPS